MTQYDKYQLEDGTYHLPDGVYFGLPEDIYHADEALGSTSIKELAKKPCKWQYDRLNPKEDLRDNPFIKWGSAWHCRVLEGEEAYAARYAKPPTPADHPGALTNMDSIKEFLKLHGKKISGKRDELITRAQEIEECPPLFEDILADWHEKNPNVEEIDDQIHTEVAQAVANMERDPILSAIMQAGSLTAGAAELSVFWTVNGMRFKCRFDYALPATKNRSNAICVDLKSFTTFKGGNDEDAAIRKVYDECYDIQAAHYLDGRVAARKLVANGHVFGDIPGKDFIDGFFMAKEVDWVWVMLRRDAGMIPITLSIGGDDRILRHGKDIVDHALDTYRAYVDRYGHDQLWSPVRGDPIRLNESSFPSYNRGVQYEQPENR